MKPILDQLCDGFEAAKHEKLHCLADYNQGRRAAYTMAINAVKELKEEILNNPEITVLEILERIG